MNNAPKLANDSSLKLIGGKEHLYTAADWNEVELKNSINSEENTLFRI